MTESDWFNKPIEKSRDLILKEAFKLFLQKNVEKVTVPELERVTKLHRGAIFYHFKDKEMIFNEVIEKYFFSPLNIFYPIAPDKIYSLKKYWKKKDKHINKIQCWFNKEEIPINVYSAFFHLAEQANLHIATFKGDMQNLLKTNKKYWIQVALSDTKLICTDANIRLIGDVLESVFMAKCYIACYCGKDIHLFRFDDVININWNHINES